MAKQKIYAKIDTRYGRQLMVPADLLERLVNEAYVVDTSYVGEKSKTVITEVKTGLESITTNFYSQEEIDVAMAQQALEGDD